MNKQKAKKIISLLQKRKLKAKTRSQQDRSIKAIYSIIEKYDLRKDFNL